LNLLCVAQEKAPYGEMMKASCVKLAFK
jgi:hypothetical protein